MQLRAEFFNILNHPNFSNPFLPAFVADPAVNGGFAINGNRETGVSWAIRSPRPATSALAIPSLEAGPARYPAGSEVHFLALDG